MGVIVRQSFKAAIVSYGAVILGFVNAAIIYPYFLETDELGELQWVIQTAIMLTPFITLGFTSVGTKFFSQFNATKTNSQQFFTLLLMAPMLSAVLFGALYLLFRESIHDYYLNHTEQGFSSIALDSLALITVCMGFNAIVNVYCANYKRIAIPTALNNLIKVALPALSISYFFGHLEYNRIFAWLVAFFVFLSILFYAYLLIISGVKPRLDFRKGISNAKLKEIYPFAFFGILAGLGSMLATRIDVFMIGTLLDKSSIAIYTFAVIATNTIALPITIVAGIATPVIAAHWKDKDMNSLNSIYAKSTLSLSLIAIGIFLTIWAGIDGLFGLMPKGDEYSGAKWALFILGMAKIVDLSSGLNSQILSMSERYKMYFYFLLILAVLNVIMNLWFVPIYRIEGAAIATFTSIAIFNLMKFIYLNVKFGLQPFGKGILKIFLLGGLVLLILSIIPKFESNWYNFIVFPVASIVVYGISAYKLRLAPDVNDLIDQKLIEYKIMKPKG